MTVDVEIGARLDHLQIEADDPPRVAAALEGILAMTAAQDTDGWTCSGPSRSVLIGHGTKNRLACAAFAFADARSLTGYRERLAREGAALLPHASPRFGPDAFAVADPDGTRAVFGHRTPDTAVGAGLPSARLQHFALRTRDPVRMLAFYERVLHFVPSDWVEDEHGALRAAFLRVNCEHHTLALFHASESRLDHMSFDTPDVVGLRDWADHMSRIRVPLFWGVGRHGPGNDLFFMVKDPEDNLVELSTELELCAPDRPAGRWPYTERTLNLWGQAFMRS